MANDNLGQITRGTGQNRVPSAPDTTYTIMEAAVKGAIEMVVEDLKKDNDLKSLSLAVTTSAESLRSVDIALSVISSQMSELVGIIRAAKILSYDPSSSSISGTSPSESVINSLLVSGSIDINGIDKETLEKMSALTGQINIDGLTGTMSDVLVLMKLFADSANEIPEADFSNLSSLLTSIDKLYSGLGDTVSKTSFDQKELIAMFSSMANIIDPLNELSLSSASLDGEAIKNVFEITKTVDEIQTTLSSLDNLDEDNLKTINNNLTQLTKIITNKGTNDKMAGALQRLITGISEIGVDVSFTKDKIEIIANTVQSVSTLFTIARQVDAKNVKKSLSELAELLSVGNNDGLFGVLNNITILNKDFSTAGQAANTLKGAVTSIMNIDKGVTMMQVLSLELKMLQMQVIAGAMSSFVKKIADIKNIKGATKNLAKLANLFAGVKNVDIKKINALMSLSSVTSNVMKAFALGLVLGLPAMVGVMLATKVFHMLGGLVAEVNAMKIDKDLDKKLTEITKIVAGASLVLVLGAYAGKIALTSFGEMLAFTFALGVFINAIMGALRVAGNNVKYEMAATENLVELIVKSALILIVGGTVLSLFPNIAVGAMGFAVILGGFLLAVGGALKLGAKALDGTEEEIKSLVALIGLSAGILIFGAMLGAQAPALGAAALVFGALLAAFIFSITWVWSKAVSGKDIGEGMKNAGQFGLLVALSGAILIAGSWFVSENPGVFWNAILFTVMLSAFMLAMVGVYAVAGKAMKDNIKVSLEFGLLVAISAGVMMAGGAFMMIPGMGWSALAFVAEFAVFSLGILLILKGLQTEVNDAGKTAILFGVTVGLLATIMFVAGSIFKNDPWMIMYVGIFMLFTAAMVGGMIFAIKMLAKLSTGSIMKSVLALGAIVVVVLAMGYTMSIIADVNAKVSEKGGWGGMFIALGFMFASIVAVALLVAGIVVVLTSTVGIGGAVIAVAEGLLAGLVGIVWLMAEATSAMADAFVKINEIAKDYGNDDKAFQNIHGFITKFIGLKDAFSGLSNPLTALALKASLSAVKDMSIAVSSVAGTIVTIASMDMPEYDSNGKATGKRVKINDTVLKQTGDAIAEIMTAIGGAIITVYNQNPQMFPVTFFGMDNPFQRVTKSIAGLGTMMSNIAYGIKSFAGMAIPKYDANGNEIGKEKIDEKIIGEAQKNIVTIITALGSTIMGLYVGELYTVGKNGLEKMALTDVQKATVKEMFAGDGFLKSDSKFGRAVRACSALGGMIASIAKGVADMAKLQVDEYDKSGAPTGHKVKLSKPDFDAAAQNVATIITVLGSAILDQYNTPEGQKIFTDPSWFGQSADKTPFSMVVKSMSGIGELISSAVTAIEAVNSNATIANLDADEISKRVQNIITCLAKGVLAAYNDGSINEAFGVGTLFDTKNPEKTPIGMIKNGMLGLREIVDVVKSTSDSLASLPADASKKIESIKELVTAVGDVMSSMVGKVDTNTDFSGIPEAVKSYIAGVDELVKLHPELPTDTSKFTTLGASINSLSGNIAGVRYSEAFSKETEDLSKFVKNVNSIDLSRVSKMMSLIDSINTLSGKFNNLDKFTESIAHQMAETFTALADEINKSTEIINKAEKLHNDRRENISKLVKEVKEVMETGLDVTIYDSDNKPDNSMGTSVGSFGGDVAVTKSASNNAGGLASLLGGGSNQAAGASIDYSRLQSIIISAIKAAGTNQRPIGS